MLDHVCIENFSISNKYEKLLEKDDLLVVLKVHPTKYVIVIRR
jgi:hypothetical protein